MRVGLIADVQYADKDDGGFEGRVQRFREAAPKLSEAAAALASERLDAVITLGDIIDGHAGDPASTLADLDAITGALGGLAAGGRPVHNVLGNHCLSAPRERVLQALRMPSSYYAAPLCPGWRLLALDSTEMSGHSGYPQGSAIAAETQAFAEAHPCGEAHPHMQPWNGGLASQQMAWLQGELAAAQAAGGRLIVALHHPLAPGSVPAHYLAWNHVDVRAALVACPAVALVLSGHYHPGGCAVEAGLPFVVLEGLVEAPPGSNAWAVLEVVQGAGGGADALRICGHGCATSRELPLRAAPGVGAG